MFFEKVACAIVAHIHPHTVLVTFKQEPICNIVDISPFLSFFIADNNFVCDCRLQWLFELKNRTRYAALREALETFVCTLHDPKISNFIEPVPNHILDLLNIGSSYNGVNSAELHLGGNNSGRKRFSKSRQNGGAQRGVSGNGQRLGQMQLNTDDDVDVIDAAAVALTPEHSEHVLSLSKRSLAESQLLTVVASSQPEVYNDALLTASGIPDIATANIVGEKKKKSVLPAKLRDDYYDEAAGLGGGGGGVGLLLAQQVELGDGLDELKQNALYNQQTNDVIGMTNTITEHAASKPQPLGIKVCLFLLKSERLPCHDELSDPTELPLSRDLMDVRSNQAQSNMSSGGDALSMATTTVVGVAAIIVHFSSRRRFA